MNIEKISKIEFGVLTSITNPETGITMFLAKEVCDNWGHTNSRQAIRNAKLDSNDFKVIELRKYKDFKEQLRKCGLLGGRASNITFVTESGLYKLVLASNKKEATSFKHWVASEVLPSIRKNGYYSISDNKNDIRMHTYKAVQTNNSIEINAKHFSENGIPAVIDYNRKNCFKHTGLLPHEVKEIGKKLGLKSVQRTSAKEVLRNTNPEIACSMSFVDNMVKDGYDFDKVSEHSVKYAIPFFQGIIELGATPIELIQK